MGGWLTKRNVHEIEMYSLIENEKKRTQSIHCCSTHFIQPGWYEQEIMAKFITPTFMKVFPQEVNIFFLTGEMALK